MKSRRVKHFRKIKRTKRGAGWFSNSSKCGEMNPKKTYSDNRNNCLKNKNELEPVFKQKFQATLRCNRGQVSSFNFPGNPTCSKDDLKLRHFEATDADNTYDGTHGLMF